MMKTQTLTPLELIEQALTKFPKAKRIAVENFTSGGTAKSDMATEINLSEDTRMYKWNSHTVNAIRFILWRNSR